MEKFRSLSHYQAASMAKNNIYALSKLRLVHFLCLSPANNFCLIFEPLFTLNLPCKITVLLRWQRLPAPSRSRHRWPDRWMETCSKLLLIWPTQEQRAKREKIKTGRTEGGWRERDREGEEKHWNNERAEVGKRARTFQHLESEFLTRSRLHCVQSLLMLKLQYCGISLQESGALYCFVMNEWRHSFFFRKWWKPTRWLTLVMLQSQGLLNVCTNFRCLLQIQ